MGSMKRYIQLTSALLGLTTIILVSVYLPYKTTQVEIGSKVLVDYSYNFVEAIKEMHRYKIGKVSNTEAHEVILNYAESIEVLESKYDGFKGRKKEVKEFWQAVNESASELRLLSENILNETEDEVIEESKIKTIERASKVVSLAESIMFYKAN